MSEACKAEGEKEVVEDLAVPTSLMEAIRILRTRDPHYDAITNPSKEQVEDLDAVIKGLRLAIDDGVDDAAGDETAYELAVALLWHADKTSIKEGILLMDYLLRERWELHWSTVTGRPPTPRDALVESVGDEDEVEGQRNDEEWTDIGAAGDAARPSGGYSAAWTSSDATFKSIEKIPVGTAVCGATAPPPPEAEDNSIPPSLTRDRFPSTTSAQAAAGSASASSTTRTLASRQHTGQSETWGRSTSSYTSPGVDSTVCNNSTSVASSTTKDDRRLARCYYHLAVGYTKLRMNSKAQFYVESTLRLCPEDREALRLDRFLGARLYVTRTLVRSVPLLAVGLLFL